MTTLKMTNLKTSMELSGSNRSHSCLKMSSHANVLRSLFSPLSEYSAGWYSIQKVLPVTSLADITPSKISLFAYLLSTDLEDKRQFSA